MNRQFKTAFFIILFSILPAKVWLMKKQYQIIIDPSQTIRKQDKGAGTLIDPSDKSNQTEKDSLINNKQSNATLLEPKPKPQRKRKHDLINQMKELKQKAKFKRPEKSEMSSEFAFDEIDQIPQTRFQKIPVKDLEDQLIKITMKKDIVESVDPSEQFRMRKALNRDQVLLDIQKMNEEELSFLKIEEDLDVGQKMTEISGANEMKGGLDETLKTQTNIQSVARNYLNLDEGLKGVVDQVVKHQLKESKREQNEIAEMMESMFQNLSLKNRNQRNCIFFQEMMKAMPSQKKTWTRKIKNFFSSQKLNNLKSYRTLALEMIQSLDVPQNEMKELQEVVEEYRIAKALYYSKYMIGWSANLDVEQDEKESLNALIASQTELVDQLFEQKQENENQYNLNLGNLSELSEHLKVAEIGDDIREREMYSKVIRTVQESEKAIPLESLDMFKKGSTVYRMVQKFNEVNNKYWKWTFLYNSLISHFQAKRTDSRARYKVQTDGAVLTKLKQRVQGVRTFFKQNSDQLKAKLIKYLEDYVKELKQRISEDPDYSQYSQLIETTADLQVTLEDVQQNYLEEKMKLEEIKFKIHKLDFTNNFDYVFPSGLILHLQKKLKEITILIENVNENENYFSLDDSDKYLTMREEKVFTKFFRDESSDLLITKERVAEQLKVALEIDEIEGKIDFFLGKMITITQMVEPEKYCFSLPDLSYFIFLLLKTNVIAKQTKFFEGFFSFSSADFSKEYIVFNYSLFAPMSYVKDLTERNKQAELDGLSNTLKDIFINDFIMNFTIMINFYKDMTEFGTAEEGVVKRSWGFVKSILNLILTSMNGQLESMNEKGMEYVVDFVTEVITGALSFLTVLPFAEDLVKKMVEPVVSTLFEYITVFFPEAYQYFHRVHESNLKNEIKSKKKNDFLLDFDQEIEKLLENKKEKKSASFNRNGTMQMIEQKYIDSMKTSGSIFLKIQNLKIFREKDYEQKVIAILESKNSLRSSQKI